MPFNHQSSFINAVTHKNNLYDIRYQVSAVYDLFYKIYKQEGKFIRIDLIIANYDLTGISHYSYVWLWDYLRINLKYSKSKILYVIFLFIKYFFSRMKTNFKKNLL